MTSLAFILGVMPLVVASGAGREARHSVGTAVVGGMVASTFLNLAFIPVLYVVVKSIGAKRGTRRRAIVIAALVAQALRPALMLAQSAPMPTQRVTFNEAIRLAVDKNPSSAIAAAGILRAEALLAEARSASRLQVNANVTTTTSIAASSSTARR